MRRIMLLVAGVLLALVVASPMALAQVGQGAKASGRPRSWPPTGGNGPCPNP